MQGQALRVQFTAAIEVRRKKGFCYPVKILGALGWTSRRLKPGGKQDGIEKQKIERISAAIIL